MCLTQCEVLYLALTSQEAHMVETIIITKFKKRNFPLSVNDKIRSWFRLLINKTHVLNHYIINTICCRLNRVPPKTHYVEALYFNVMIFRSAAFGKKIGLDEVLKMDGHKKKRCLSLSLTLHSCTEERPCKHTTRRQPFFKPQRELSPEPNHGGIGIWDYSL